MMALYKLDEARQDDLAISTEYFISTPKGRMSIRIPNFVNREEHDDRVGAIVLALNNAGILASALKWYKNEVAHSGEPA